MRRRKPSPDRFTLIVDGGTVDASSNSFTVRNTGKVEIKNGGSLTAYDGSIRNKVVVTGEGSTLTFGGNVYGESPSGENGAPVYGTASIVVDNGAAARFTGLVIGGNGSGARQSSRDAGSCKRRRYGRYDYAFRRQ